MEKFEPNEIFSLAADIIRNTSQSVFLTGKAGTGKTTFLRYICNNIDKNIIVAAPTGVAAINAGGVTIHSLLQLPFEPFIPNAEGRKKLEYHFKLRKSKIEMLRELDLLIIDEVSMLRADILDAIDHMLKRYRNPFEPFGGVQMLYIGDMFQLPPVVQASEWEQLKEYYPSPFFFHAMVLNNNLPLYIELKNIYRQSDQRFIEILNRIRNNQTTANDLNILNQRYDPNFNLSENEGYIVLCTHNYKAERINSEELTRLDGREHLFSGQIKGDFSDNSLPTELKLSLKVGARVMFVRNDAGENRRYYNGKLATIDHIVEDKIHVRFDNGNIMELERETWRNVRYKLNTDSNEIEEEELGTFTQFPVRLAWAITIHKSQGLTFDKVIIDAGQAFAGGQVYVALSRCTTLEGIVLFSRITQSSIHTDDDAIRFAREEKNIGYLRNVLSDEKPRYTAQRLKKCFDWTPLMQTLQSFRDLVNEKKIPNQSEVLEMASELLNKASEQEEFARNFGKELDRILTNANPNIDYLSERVGKASLYFHKGVQNNILLPLIEHASKMKNVARVKKYNSLLQEKVDSVQGFLNKLENIHYGSINLTEGLTFESLDIPEPTEEEKKKKGEKGDSQRITLQLFEEGMNIPQIAKERNLSVITVEGHITAFVGTGEIAIEKLMDLEKIEKLKVLFENIDTSNGLKEIKESLPEEYSYFDIKLMLNHLAYKKMNED